MAIIVFLLFNACFVEDLEIYIYTYRHVFFQVGECYKLELYHLFWHFLLPGRHVFTIRYLLTDIRTQQHLYRYANVIHFIRREEGMDEDLPCQMSLTRFSWKFLEDFFFWFRKIKIRLWSIKQILSKNLLPLADVNWIWNYI